jgi:DNA primase
MYTQESLQKLRDQIDLIDLLSSYIDLKKMGASYKALCPFHDEKSPSFMVRQGDSHYHCFGCGAHGDAIRFLMEHQSLSFREAVEALAERYQLPMDKEEGEKTAPNKTRLYKECLQFTSRLYYHFLIHTPEGKAGLHYLFSRGITVDFIRRFQVGWAPENGALFFQATGAKKFSKEVLSECGLLTSDGNRPFFRERITFPIRNAQGSVVGFSARKIREETFGGKYINSPETPLFKKSKLLFGMDCCRRNIAKEGRALIVEGQIDCLKLIEEGFEITAASLGTAFQESHVAELIRLGVKRVDLLFDADNAGQAAISKTGDLFQKEGIAVGVAIMPKGEDPDSYLRKFGVEKFRELIKSTTDYLSFQIRYLGEKHNPHTPAGKASLVKEMKTQIQGWQDPVMIHESLKQLSQMLDVPEETLGLNPGAFRGAYKRETLQLGGVDPGRILEFDLLRWLFKMGSENGAYLSTAATYLKEEDFYDPVCRALFLAHVKHPGAEILEVILESGEEKAAHYVEEMMKQRLNLQKAEGLFLDSVQKLVDRRWLEEREEIKRKIHSGKYSDEEVLELAKAFDSKTRVHISMVTP